MRACTLADRRKRRWIDSYRGTTGGRQSPGQRRVGTAWAASFPSASGIHGPAGGAGLDKAIAEDRVFATRSERVRFPRQSSAQRVGVGRSAPHHLQGRSAERKGCCEGGAGLISPLAIG